MQRPEAPARSPVTPRGGTKSSGPRREAWEACLFRPKDRVEGGGEFKDVIERSQVIGCVIGSPIGWRCGGGEAVRVAKLGSSELSGSSKTEWVAVGEGARLGESGSAIEILDVDVCQERISDEVD